MKMVRFWLVSALAFMFVCWCEDGGEGGAWGSALEAWFIVMF